MRSVVLIPLTLMVTVALGCGSEEREQASTSVSERDLTRQAPAPEVEIASPVELQQLRTQHRTVRSSRPVKAPRRRTVEAKLVARAGATAPAVVLPAAEPVAQPTTTADLGSDRELLPGKTITLIPASSGPSTASEPTDELPTVRGGTIGIVGGGRCPPRRPGRGIGIAGVPRPGLY
jgi:hypothetical protein